MSEEEGPEVDELEPDAATGPTGRRLLIGLAGFLALLLVGVVVITTRDQDARTTPTPSLRASTPSTRPSPEPTPTPAPSGSGGSTGFPRQPETIRTGPALLPGVPADFVVHVSGPGAVYRIEPGTGEIVRTGAPELAENPPGGLTALPGGVVVEGPMMDSARRLYLDGESGSALPVRLSEARFVLPGPRTTLWVGADSGNSSGVDVEVTTLHARDGTEVGRARLDWGSLGDGEGRLLITQQGRVWRLDADLTPRLLADGAVDGIGAEHMVLTRCDAELRCFQYLTDREGGQERLVREVAQPNRFAPGAISPDGRWMIEPRLGQGSLDHLLVDLATGEDQGSVPPAAHLGAGISDGSDTWLPDSSGYLSLRDGELVLVEPETRDVTALDTGLTALTSVVHY